LPKEHDRSSAEHLLLVAIDASADNKLTRLTIQLDLNGHFGLPTEGEFDLLAEAEGAFLPKKSGIPFPKKSRVAICKTKSSTDKHKGAQRKAFRLRRDAGAR